MFKSNLKLFQHEDVVNETDLMKDIFKGICDLLFLEYILVSICVTKTVYFIIRINII